MPIRREMVGARDDGIKSGERGMCATIATRGMNGMADGVGLCVMWASKTLDRASIIKANITAMSSDT